MTAPTDAEAQLREKLDEYLNDFAAQLLEEFAEYLRDPSAPEAYRPGFAFLEQVLRWRIERLRGGTAPSHDEIQRIDRAIRLGERQ